MRSALALLGGMSISALGVALTLSTVYDLGGVLLITAGGLVAALGPRVLRTLRTVGGHAQALSPGRAQAGLSARLAQRRVERRRAG
jgi:hypothetical protein